MASAYFIVFSVLSQLLLLHSAAKEKSYAPGCPPFHCGYLGMIGFPFTNNSAQSKCGILTVDDCHDYPEPVKSKIQLKKDDKWYDVVSISPADSIGIIDPSRVELLQSKNCAALENFTFPSSPSISFTLVMPNITLFKCNRTLNITSHADFNYTGCRDYNIYYNNPDDRPPILSPQCSSIQLPINISHRNNYDLFGLLATDIYYIQPQVSGDCRDCYNRGGQCQMDSNGNFRCAPANESEGLGTAGKSKIEPVIIIVAVIGVSLFMICCIMRIFSSNLSMVFWGNQTQRHRSVEVLLRNYGSLAPKRYIYSDVKKMTYSFKDKLGQGGFGGVYKGKLHDGRLVAVKVLNESKDDGEEFLNEVASISRTSHVNIVTLLGFCFEGSKRALVYEFMPNGSLEKFIYENPLKKNRLLRWETLYQIAIGIARGLEYLHGGCNTRILHFDIKPHNILLDEEFCPKISDFGLSKLCPEKHSIISMLGARGTAGFIAPEVFCRNFGGVSHKSDVYSYGMMVLEMVGGRKNFDDGVDAISEIYFPHWIYRRIEDGDELGLHGVINEEENEKARKMILVSLWCIQTDPSHRPSMGSVLNMLEGSIGSLQIPPKPFLSSPPRSPTDSSSTSPIVTTL